MLQQTNSCIVVQNILLCSFESFLSIALAKGLRSTEESRYHVVFTTLTLLLKALLDCFVKLSANNHLLYSLFWSVRGTHISVMRNISVNWVSDLINICVRSLNFQVVSEVKMSVEKYRPIYLCDSAFDNHWKWPGAAAVIEIFCIFYNKKKNPQ